MSIKMEYMPNVIEHFTHTQHPLILATVDLSTWAGMIRTCDVCRDPVEGQYYTCRDCNFDVHLLCTKLPQSFSHPAHMHHLRLQLSPRSGTCYDCRRPCVCGSSCNCEIWCYRCERCNVNVHLECLLVSIVHETERSTSHISSSGCAAQPLPPNSHLASYQYAPQRPPTNSHPAVHPSQAQQYASQPLPMYPSQAQQYAPHSVPSTYPVANTYQPHPAYHHHSAPAGHQGPLQSVASNTPQSTPGPRCGIGRIVSKILTYVGYLGVTVGANVIAGAVM